MFVAVGEAEEEVSREVGKVAKVGHLCPTHLSDSVIAIGEGCAFIHRDEKELYI